MWEWDWGLFYRPYLGEIDIASSKNVRSSDNGKNGSTDKTEKPSGRRTRGLKASFERLLEVFVLYLETLLIYFQKHTELFLKKFVVKVIWFVLVFFTFCIGFAYLSFALFNAFQIHLGLDVILSSLLVSLTFLLASFLFLRFLIHR